jgi:hypothetical protein
MRKNTFFRKSYSSLDYMPPSVRQVSIVHTMYIFDYASIFIRKIFVKNVLSSYC